jgi:hypothetical protein
MAGWLAIGRMAILEGIEAGVNFSDSGLTVS